MDELANVYIGARAGEPSTGMGNRTKQRNSARYVPNLSNRLVDAACCAGRGGGETESASVSRPGSLAASEAWRSLCSAVLRSRSQHVSGDGWVHVGESSEMWSAQSA